MQVYKNLKKEEWKDLINRPYTENSSLLNTVGEIIKTVKKEGDAALRKYAENFDKHSRLSLEVREEEIAEATGMVDENLKKAILQAKKNIETFHAMQVIHQPVIEVLPGVKCWRRSVGIEKVGIYIPGGTAPLFSTVLMLAIPATLAGCKEVIMCTPAGEDGKIHPAILYAASITGIKRIFATGGAQAIAAMAFGTETIPAVYKIFGPGNQYVTIAKQLVQMEGVAIDMPAGPSELMVLCDESAVPAFVASDLLSQAEHGADSQVMLVSTSEKIVEEVLLHISRQLSVLSRASIAEKALQNSKAFVLASVDQVIDLANDYAAEHLLICTRDAENLAERVVNAGSVFIGNYSPESAGDYASGTNHTLPTNGFARAYSGVSVDSFVKNISFQKLTKQGLENISESIVAMAMEEGLDAHARAVTIRKTQNNDGDL